MTLVTLVTLGQGAQSCAMDWRLVWVQDAVEAMKKIQSNKLLQFQQKIALDLLYLI